MFSLANRVVVNYYEDGIYARCLSQFLIVAIKLYSFNWIYGDSCFTECEWATVTHLSIILGRDILLSLIRRCLSGFESKSYFSIAEYLEEALFIFVCTGRWLELRVKNINASLLCHLTFNSPIKNSKLHSTILFADKVHTQISSHRWTNCFRTNKKLPSKTASRSLEVLRGKEIKSIPIVLAHFTMKGKT